MRFDEEQDDRPVAPVLEGCREVARDHSVQFYESDAFLLDGLARYIAVALDRGESAVAVLTEGHRDGLERRLIADGVDLDAARASGAYLVFDAAETLAKIIVDGLPSRAPFEEVIGGALDLAARDGRPVFAFGEMVAILWQEGRHEAAIRLEELWNELSESRVFRLLCAYPVRLFGAEPHSAGFDRICGHHTRVIPSESYSPAAADDTRAREILRLQRKAAALEAEISARRKAEDELRTHERQQKAALEREHALRLDLEAANADLRDFAYILSHDLKEPLHGISTSASFLLDDLSGSERREVRERAATIQRLARRSYDLLDAVLEFGRVGRRELQISEMELQTVFARAIEGLKGRIDEEGANVTFEPTTLRVLADPTLTLLALTYLITNALKYNESNPKQVTLGCRLGDQGHAVFFVRDNGIGIEPRHQECIFRMFKRLHPRERYGGGTGAGLAIVGRIVERHRGRVWVESTAGEGSTFCFTLGRGPVALATAHAPS
jgi:signal transduction histidine kinase